MMHAKADKTYTPMLSDFEHVVATYFPNVAISPEQMQSLKVMFFAGAAASYSLITETPDRIDTFREEMLDHAEQMQASA